MASQANAILLLSHKTLYSQQLIYISPLKCSKICMPILSSVRPCAKANITGAEEVIDLASPLSITNTRLFAREASSHLVDHHGMKAIILPQVDANKRMHELKENTRRALMMTSDPKMTLKLIDTIQRLGVGYWFEEEIKNILENLTQVLPDDDLYTVALNFRLRRQGGLHTNPADLEHRRKCEPESLRAKKVQNIADIFLLAKDVKDKLQRWESERDDDKVKIT